MAETLKMIASIEWMAIGVLVLFGIRKWNKRFSKLHDELKKGIEEMNDG